MANDGIWMVYSKNAENDDGISKNIVKSTVPSCISLILPKNTQRTISGDGIFKTCDGIFGSMSKKRGVLRCGKNAVNLRKKLENTVAQKYSH